MNTPVTNFYEMSATLYSSCMILQNSCKGDIRGKSSARYTAITTETGFVGSGPPSIWLSWDRRWFGCEAGAVVGSRSKHGGEMERAFLSHLPEKGGDNADQNTQSGRVPRRIDDGFAKPCHSCMLPIL